MSDLICVIYFMNGKQTLTGVGPDIFSANINELLDFLLLYYWEDAFHFSDEINCN